MYKKKIGQYFNKQTHIICDLIRNSGNILDFDKICYNQNHIKGIPNFLYP